MSQNFNKPDYIIVLGTTYSGSGSVFDYLIGRGDLYDPLKGEEYLLPQTPNGFMSLEAASEKFFHPAIAEYALFQFEYLISKIFTIWKSNHNDTKFHKNLNFYEKEFKKFIDEITIVDFPIALYWREINLFNTKSFFLHFVKKLKQTLGFYEKINKTRLIESGEKVVHAAQKLHKKIFLNKFNQTVVLNQAGSAWNPKESTKYFSNTKVIIVTRDPYDQFVELKKYKRAVSVSSFIEWYKEMQKHLKKNYNSDFLYVKFENFVENHDMSVKELCNFTGLSNKIKSRYDPHSSKKNINQFNRHLDENEIKKIRKNLF